MPEKNIPSEFFDKYPNSVLKSKLRRIWEQIEENWGTLEGVEYLESLVIVEEGRSRQGFDFDVVSELLWLGELHEFAYPEFARPRLGNQNKFTFETLDKSSEEI
jgi:hypothetical protein